ncbi:MFS transporter [Pseudonocardia eucalypti]|uniref:MFS transporter n=1 Tax=Pseudonocardia eucalypti TaxID=648755 RepID=A0ABP9Q8K5_9PSEU|nr:MHS family alpha-ketoglutarate permease-like MFS transporter [Pseudonocardia eucalypti]
MTTSVAPGKSVNRRALLGLGLGNTVEWYDWQVYGLLAALIGPHFFPAADPVSATLNALAVFAVGFAARPFGGMLLGTVADRVGRRTVMLVSVGIMAVSTVVIAVLPTYQQIGPWAGIILVACRLAQGLSTGVEAPLGTAYAAELAPGQEGRYAGGMISMFVNFGVVGAPLVAFLASSVLGDAAMAEWGWRVPFVVGALLGVVVIYLRRALPETLHEGEEAPKESAGEVWREVGRHWAGLLAIVFVVGAVQAYSYAWNVGLPNLARGTFREDPTTVYGLTTLVGLIMIIGAPLVGRWADRVRLSRAYLAARVLAVPTVFLMLAYAAPGIGTLATVLLVGGVVLTLNMTLYNVVSVSLMPRTCRASGCGIGYGIGVALFGGTASYLLVWLQRGGLGWVFPVYLAVLCVISVALYVFARRKGEVYVGE